MPRWASTSIRYPAGPGQGGHGRRLVCSRLAHDPLCIRRRPVCQMGVSLTAANGAGRMPVPRLNPLESCAFGTVIHLIMGMGRIKGVTQSQSQKSRESQFKTFNVSIPSNLVKVSYQHPWRRHPAAALTGRMPVPRLNPLESWAFGTVIHLIMGMGRIKRG